MREGGREGGREREGKREREGERGSEREGGRVREGERKGEQRHQKGTSPYDFFLVGESRLYW